MDTLLIALAGGAAAFAHCLGMCGPFALHLSQSPSRARLLANQLLWHLGKTTTYVFLGALAGLFGGFLPALVKQPWIQNVSAYLAGALMIVMGLKLLGAGAIFKSPARSAAKIPSPSNEGGGIIASLFSQALANPAPGSALVLGLATGFLPCPIVLAFLALSAYSGSVWVGMITMAAMGAGTVWSLLLCGLAGYAVKVPLRRWSPLVGGVLIIAMGSTTILRGTEIFHRFLGCGPLADPAAKAAQPAAHSCCCADQIPTSQPAPSQAASTTQP